METIPAQFKGGGGEREWMEAACTAAIPKTKAWQEVEMKQIQTGSKAQ